MLAGTLRFLQAQRRLIEEAVDGGFRGVERLDVGRPPVDVVG